VIAGLRTAFVSSGNQRGNWAMRIVHGQPPHFEAAMEQLLAAKMWVMLCGTVVTMGAVAAFRLVAPAELLTRPATAAQLLVAAGMCVLLTDAFFLNVTMVPFTGEPQREPSNLAFTMLRYFTLFPVVTALSIASEYWIENSAQHFGIAAISIVVAHLWFRKRHRDVVRLHSSQLELEEGEEEFPLRLGLRY
jgi:FtsH-binding integral membrane protein